MLKWLHVLYLTQRNKNKSTKKLREKQWFAGQSRARVLPVIYQSLLTFLLVLREFRSMATGQSAGQWGKNYFIIEYSLKCFAHNDSTHQYNSIAVDYMLLKKRVKCRETLSTHFTKTHGREKEAGKSKRKHEGRWVFLTYWFHCFVPSQQMFYHHNKRVRQDRVAEKTRKEGGRIGGKRQVQK